uniref:Kazal-like domain-containing protein n=1 Tax=Monodelphis domestica TaxID=13616 RepID=A0A5F8G853_MONDO
MGIIESKAGGEFRNHTSMILYENVITFGGTGHVVSLPDCKMYGNPGCPRDLNPVCGTDSLTYPNECSLCEKSREQGKDIQIKWKGFC